MKKSLGTFFVVFYCGFGVVLFFNLTQPPEEMVIRVSSDKALINLDDPEFLDGLRYGKIFFKADNPNAQILVRSRRGIRTQIGGQIRTNAQLIFVNPAGVTISQDAILDWDDLSSIDIAPPRSSQSEPLVVGPTLKAHGNVYALAINQDGAIKASKPIILETPEGSSDAPAESGD